MFQMTLEEYQEHESENDGFCISCKQPHSGYCEPDARECHCENCHKNLVYGVPELVLMGKVELV